MEVLELEFLQKSEYRVAAVLVRFMRIVVLTMDKLRVLRLVGREICAEVISKLLACAKKLEVFVIGEIPTRAKSSSNLLGFLILKRPFNQLVLAHSGWHDIQLPASVTDLEINVEDWMDGGFKPFRVILDELIENNPLLKSGIQKIERFSFGLQNIDSKQPFIDLVKYSTEYIQYDFVHFTRISIVHPGILFDIEIPTTTPTEITVTITESKLISLLPTHVNANYTIIFPIKFAKQAKNTESDTQKNSNNGHVVVGDDDVKDGPGSAEGNAKDGANLADNDAKGADSTKYDTENGASTPVVQCNFDDDDGCNPDDYNMEEIQNAYNLLKFKRKIRLIEITSVAVSGKFLYFFRHDPEESKTFFPNLVMFSSSAKQGPSKAVLEKLAKRSNLHFLHLSNLNKINCDLPPHFTQVDKYICSKMLTQAGNKTDDICLKTHRIDKTK